MLFVGGCTGAVGDGLLRRRSDAGALQGEMVRQRAGGFYQAGSLGFGALAVFGLTLLAQRTLPLRQRWVCLHGVP